MTFAPTLTTADLAVALVAATRGDVVTAHDPSYPAACFGYLATGGDAPEIVVIAAAAGDVAAGDVAAGDVAAVRLVAGAGSPRRPPSTPHRPAG
ncbi:MAG TPA: hypothetical protein VES60_03770 [Nakamurella sp.]|nr:hypothetical protein [Nakamurella sp.]